MEKEKAQLSFLQKRRISIRRKFILFSSLLFLVILSVCSIAFYISMGRFVFSYSGHELSRLIEIERLKLENNIKTEIAMVKKMASSPFLIRYFENPEDPYLERIAFEELAIYREAFDLKTIFWVNDKDKRFHYDNEYVYLVDPDDPANYWYNMTLFDTEEYNININFNPDLNTINIWINAPVFNREQKPIAVLGAGKELSGFINRVYGDYLGVANLYYFNFDGEITSAQNAELAANKIKIYNYLGETGIDIFHRAIKLDDDEIAVFRDSNGVGNIVVSRVPLLNWYVTAVLPLQMKEILKTPVTVLFIAMMAVIAITFVIFNLFAMDLLGPLSSMLKTMNKISVDLDIRNHLDDIENIETFFNMAITDPLTGIYNRRFMEGNLNKLLKTLSRTNEQLSILMIDIDFFKNYNDSYGHDNGDECLKTVAGILSKCVRREGDFLARFGGEEFVAVLPNTGEDGAKLIAYNMMNKIQEHNIPHKNSSIADYVTVSIGGTTARVNHAHNANDYIKCADKALYKSKNNGRNQYNHEKFDV